MPLLGNGGDVNCSSLAVTVDILDHLDARLVDLLCSNFTSALVGPELSSRNSCLEHLRNFLKGTVLDLGNVEIDEDCGNDT